MEERGVHLFEENSHAGWATPQFTAPKKAKSCTKTTGTQYKFIENHAWARDIFLTHMNFIWWWTFLPRLDQYWGMFAPYPHNTDYWFVIDGELISKSTQKITHRDLWKDYAFGATSNSNDTISFEKYANPHDLTISDRWRKYTYTTFAYRSVPDYRRYFAEYWCKKYNNTESPYKLDKLVIYGVSQVIKKDYLRGDINSEILWQHCCLQNGCFNTPTQ